jgi:glycosyltransferase involved in cell wall biosynthesis
MESCRYVVISPVRNEEKFVRMTMESVANQTVRPAEWIIVDDGSSDNTAAIVSEFAETHPWIKLMRKPDRGERALGAGVVETFKFGFDRISVTDYEYIVKLDADLSFGPRYFEGVFERFAQNPALGISSGKTYIREGEGLILERMADTHVRGASKVYRRPCFEQIGGLVSIIGWDSVDELYAQYHGWETRSYSELVLEHHRPMGTSHGSALRGKVRWGKGRYVTGSHPLFILASGIYRMSEKPYILGGLALIYGYASAWFSGHERIPEPEVRRFQRRRELRRLLPSSVMATLLSGSRPPADFEHDSAEGGSQATLADAGDGGSRE